MKKILSSFFILLLSLFLFSCGEKSDNDKNEQLDPVGITFHYKRFDDDYDSYGIWVWPYGGEGKLYYFDETDDYGGYVTIPLSELSNPSKVGFIVRLRSEWVKDVDTDRFAVLSLLEADSNANYNVYLVTGDSQIYLSKEGAVTDMIQKFNLIYKNNNYYLEFLLTNDYKEYEIIYNDSILVSSKTQTDDAKAEYTSKGLLYNLGSTLPDITKQFLLNVTFATDKKISETANISNIYMTAGFNEKYNYDGELGALYSNEKTTFRVWSPVSTSMKLRIYSTGTPKSMGGSDIYEEYNMSLKDKGVWEYELSGNNEGKYYTYVVNNFQAKNQEVVDPYAKSTGINGLRGMIVDFTKTNPEGWENVQVLDIPSTSYTVYECHIADLTSSSTWNGTKENAKLFTGFYEENTTYTSDNVTVKTGFDHIKELGVNAVQLLPIFDAANDERNGYKSFNWGYNPLNYNSLDGIYSKNPYDGYEKIKEFKSLIKAYNAAGINIIMDVVYNHVNSLDDSNFNALMPGYYFRYSNGAPSNGSGCGNETASNMPMFSKFMVDSTSFWASEYKLGGFRFDLMGLHDLDTMAKLAKNLHDNVNENITVYGEPWTGGSAAYPSTKLAVQSNLGQYEEYGCFNDKMRDALIKGGMCAKTEKGWVTSTEAASSGDITNIVAGVKGNVLSFMANYDTSKCVNYVTCHDNYTLYDRIKACGITDEATIKKMAILANSVVFTSQGITFMQSGEEVLRTKGGNSNSYNASYQTNEINYSLKIKNIDVFKIYQKLISLKQNTNLFGLDFEKASNINITVSPDNSTIEYTLVDIENNKEYKIIHANGSVSNHTINLEGYTLYLDTLGSEIELTAQTVINPYQTIIAVK